jgi:phage terminase small subunit
MGRSIDNPANFGPAMKALNTRQQQFVIAVLELGSTNYTRAAMMAGYEGTPEAMRVQAYRLAHGEKIVLALNEEAKRRLMASAPMAISELIKIAENEPEKKYKLKAIELILNRTGHHSTTEHKVAVEHTYNDQQSVARIVALAKQLQMDPTKLLGSAGIKVDDKGQIVDAEFTEVQQEGKEVAPLEQDNFTWKGDDDGEG